MAEAKTASLSLPSTPGLLREDQIKDLIQRVVANDLENDKKQRDYTYIERDVENSLDGKGNTKSTETKTYEVLQVYGEQVQRLIEKVEYDGQAGAVSLTFHAAGIKTLADEILAPQQHDPKEKRA